jgi:hypothetical protein
MSTVLRDRVEVLRQECSVVLDGFVEAAIASCGDFAVVESAGNSAIKKLRTVLMSAGLKLSSEGKDRSYSCPDCGMDLRGWRQPDRCVVTAEGEATYTPVRWRCARCNTDHYPVEEANGLSGSQFTTGAKAVIGEAAAEKPYAHVSYSLGCERGLTVSPKEVDRTAREVSGWRLAEEEALLAAAYGAQAARLRAEDRDPLVEVAPLHGFAGWSSEKLALVSVDGAMVRSPVKGAAGLEWFECRAGLIAPVQEHSPAETAYVAGVFSPDALFDRLAASYRRGGLSNRRCVFLGDGARWIWDRVPLYFEGATEVLDIYHAGEHVASAAVACYGEKTELANLWRKEARQMLLAPFGPKRLLHRLVEAMRHPQSVIDPEALRTEFRYLWGHRNRMRYHQWKCEGLPIGSGIMESAIKQLSCQRLRQPGMKWTRQGADAILRLRAAHLSGSLLTTAQRRHGALKEMVRGRYAAPAAIAA